MSKDPGTCFLCGGAATVGAPRDPTGGGILPVTQVDCEQCRVSYFIPKGTDLAKLKALSKPQKARIVGQIHEYERSHPSGPPYTVDDAAIAKARG